MIRAATTPAEPSRGVFQSSALQGWQSLSPCTAEPELRAAGTAAQCRCCVCDFVCPHHCAVQSEHTHPNSPLLLWVCQMLIRMVLFPNDSVNKYLSLFCEFLLSCLSSAEASWVRFTSGPRKAINSSPLRFPNLRFEQPPQMLWAQKLPSQIKEISLQEFQCEILVWIE